MIIFDTVCQRKITAVCLAGNEIGGEVTVTVGVAEAGAGLDSGVRFESELLCAVGVTADGTCLPPATTMTVLHLPSDGLRGYSSMCTLKIFSLYHLLIEIA